MTENRDSPQPADVGRRLFFRRFAGDLVTAATSVLGAAQALQEQSAEAARDLLATEDARPSSPTGFRTAFRWDGDVCRVVDQRELPDALVEIEVRGVGDAAGAIRQGAVTGPAAAQLAAIALAQSAGRFHASRPSARRATIVGGSNALRATRPSSAAVAAAVGRLLRRFEGLPDEASGDEMAAALRAEAESIVAEATDAHGRLVALGLPALPGPPDGTLRVLMHGSTGAIAGGQYGTGVGLVQAAFHAGRPVEVAVLETRPGFEGARVTAWELAQAGIPTRVATDAAAGALLAGGVIDVVIVGAERIVANGDLAGVVGTYPVAVLAARHGVPFLVCAPTPTVDLALADGAAVPSVDGPSVEVTRAGGRRMAPNGMRATNPVVDITPAELVTAILTEEGVLRPPYQETLVAAVTAAAERRARAVEAAPAPGSADDPTAADAASADDGPTAADAAAAPGAQSAETAPTVSSAEAAGADDPPETTGAMAETG